jgi:galactokinase
MDTTILRKRFKEQFNNTGDLFFAPGRINLIGEHTDYNGGFVLPGAVDKGITVEISPNGSRTVKVLAIDINPQRNYAEFDLDSSFQPEQHWAGYVFGVCMEMQKRGIKVGGFDAAFSGDVPLGAGMSSSAALESAFAVAINKLFASNLVDRFELAKIGQATEHNYCGIKCGIMDQFASLFGKENCLIRLDCRSMEYEYFPFDPKGYKLVLINSGVKHTLGTEYNDRRESCERIVEFISKSYPHVESLRDVSINMLKAIKNEVDATDYVRAKYIIEEKERVLDVCNALKEGNYELVGKKMYETHWGLSRDYTVSCDELDYLVTLAQENGVTGSRIMGGGFGGCTINLVRDTLENSFISLAKRQFCKKYGQAPAIHRIVISGGAKQIK